MILASHGIIASSGAGVTFDTDAQAFITAASISDLTQQTAINSLVTDLKTYNIWTKMKSLYPFVGGTASTHKFNLKDPRDLDAAYRLTFNGGWTHSSTGALPNGTNGYANTFLAPSLMAQNSTHFSFYSRTDTTGLKIDIGANVAVGCNFGFFARHNSTAILNINTNFSNTAANTDSLGFYIGSRTASTTQVLFKNSTKIINGAGASLTPLTYNIYIGATNYNGTVQNYSNRQTAFASIGDGLTDAEAANFYTAVQAYQTTLGRQV
jgi:hypothetical protein